MTSRILTTLGKAITHLKRADVLGATAVIRRSLGIGSRDGQAPPKRVRATIRTAKGRDAHPSGASVAPPPAALRTSTDEQLKTLKRAAGFTDRTYHSNAGSLTYKLYVPAQCSTEDLALILMLHGCTQDPDDFARGTGMNALADEFGFIVAYPHQPRTANPNGCWNWFDDRHQHRDAGEPALLAGLARDLAREFMVGGDRIFVAGLSAGGAMADVLATIYPEVFSAAGIHSGVPAGVARSMMSAMPAMKGARLLSRHLSGPKHPMVRKIIFHGDADRTVSPVNGDRIFNRSRPRRLNVAEATTDTTINGRTVTRTSIMRPDGGSLAEHWAVHGSGHAWSGGQTGGTFVDTEGPDASREMVRFFLQR